MIDGPNVQFTEAVQFLSKLTTKKRTDRFRIQIKARDTDFAHLVETTLKKGQIGFEITEMTVEVKQVGNPLPFKHFTLYPKMSTEEIRALGDKGSNT